MFEVTQIRLDGLRFGWMEHENEEVDDWGGNPRGCTAARVDWIELGRMEAKKWVNARDSSMKQEKPR